MIRVVDGDLLDADEMIRLQQVNCQGRMNKGLGKKIRIKYPEVYIEYVKHCAIYRKIQLFGTVLATRTHDGKIMINLFSQMYYGIDNQQTDYDALEKCLMTVRDFAVPKNISIAIPFGMGCGNGGGDWNEVMSRISKVFGDYDITIYKKDGE